MPSSTSQGRDGANVHVAVIAENPETADGLHRYLQSAGIASHTARELRTKLPTKNTTALVLFPDEFMSADVIGLIGALRASQPRLLIVIVTTAARRLRAALAPDGRSLVPVLIPKPAFGWAILDAIRQHARIEIADRDTRQKPRTNA